MGIDIGTIALSATLFDARSRNLHPIYWSSAHPRLNLTQSYKLTFANYLATHFNQKDVEYKTHPAASEHFWLSSDSSMQRFYTQPLFHGFKPYLNVALPFLSSDTQQWEPRIRVSETEALPLIEVRRFLTEVLKSFLPGSYNSITCGTDGLTPELFQTALQRLAGVVFNYPDGSSDAYQFNLREAILEAGLVQDAARVYFLEDAIAALLAELYLHKRAPKRSGPILIVSAGTSITELGLANVPAEQHTLSRSDLFQGRLAYAGNALDQDIICQLLYPMAQGWDDLQLQTLDLPLPGEPDLETRLRLQQRLESLPLGQKLLKVVRQIKPLLCQQDISFTIENSGWTLRQQDLYNWVIAPYLQQLNREINRLLTQAGIAGHTVRTIVYTGGTMTIPAIGEWLQQKFSSAISIQDPLADQGYISSQQVAKGLAVLPQFPAVLDSSRHQYHDYFLLRELLQLLLEQSEQLYTSSRLVKLLEERGIPKNICKPFVKNILEGQLPTGLTVTKASAALLSPSSAQQINEQELTSRPLFTRQEGSLYRLNCEQRDRLWNYLQMILSNTHQTLDAPLTIQFQSDFAT